MVVTICYGQRREWETRKEAANFFYEGILHSEGSERDRYFNVLNDIASGKDVCTDEEE